MNIADIEQHQAAQAAGAPPLLEIGVVTSTNPLQADCSGTPENVTAARSYTPVVGDSVIMARMRGITVLLDAVAAGQIPPVAPAPTITGTEYFPALQTYSWRDGSSFQFLSDVRQGSLDVSGAWSGAWFHQGGPGASLFGATVTGCAIRLSRASGGTPGPQPAHLYQSSTSMWPVASLDSPPTPTGSPIDAVLPQGDTQWVTLPTALGQAIVDGDVGIMLSGSTPMVILNGIETDPESGLLRIDWTR